jgi:hypothetical protein
VTDDLGVLPGGHRRIDRLLGEQHDVAALDLTELRRLRDDAEQEETDASYLRRLLEGRIDIVEAELRHRRGEAGDLISQLPRILADEGAPGAPRGLGRHTAAEPSRADAHRRHVEQLVADVDLSDVRARTDDELERALAAFKEEERRISTARRRLQQLMDAAHGELTRRYRDGEADPATLLPTDAPGA